MRAPQPQAASALALAALGVVYGDIGTSPLYTIREVFAGTHPVPIDHANILGVLSLIVWSLVVIVALKYVLFVMRADNKGEGGIMALMALALHRVSDAALAQRLMLLGLFGAALFYGDSVITPAISVLSAIEGLEVATPAFQPYVLPLSLAVLAGLFLVQQRGTGAVGRLFGPVMVIWFLALAVLGVANIVRMPQVLLALNPVHAVRFFGATPSVAFLSMGAAVLAVTGAEALYADMGHFGRAPIRRAWFVVVMPALILNYLGQGALLLADESAIKNPFYLMAPGWALYPLVALATAATVIASQAVISGAYSLSRQAIQLGYAPRMAVEHTSSAEIGQIFLPAINWALLAAVAALVLGFRSSSRLAAAYGVAVTGTMIITTVLAYYAARTVWGWSRLRAGVIVAGFLCVDLAYFAANLLKIHEGGWFPLALAAVVFTLMTTWKRGRSLLQSHLSGDSMAIRTFISSLALDPVPTIPGTAVFMTPNVKSTPHALLHSLKHYKCLHERVVLLTVEVVDVPYVPPAQRVSVAHLDRRFHQVTVHFGFMDEPDLPKAVDWCAEQGLDLDMADTTFFLGRETLIPRPGRGMPLWREKLFIAMFRNSPSAASYFCLPPNRVVELGSQVVL